MRPRRHGHFEQPPDGIHTVPEARREVRDMSRHLVGVSPAFLQVLEKIRRMAQFPATVLLEGETGTGKELAARAIHYLGPFCNGPFVPVNCGAIPDGLAENELFGHVRGAFTGAEQQHRGIFAAAEGGTLFLDEVECLALKTQATLLRVVQDSTYRPLGGSTPVRGHVRIIVASNRDLPAMVRGGDFREDLYYRLSVLCVRLPSLRERPADIPLLARHFMRKFARQYGLPEKRLSPEAEARLVARAWPGNVRELENVIHRHVLLVDGTEIEIDDEAAKASAGGSPDEPPRRESIPVPHGMPFSTAKERVIEDFERRFLARLMSDSGGNVSLAARLCGKERRTLGRLLKKHGLDRNACHEER